MIDTMPKRPKRLVLASASPRRSELLRRMQLNFVVYPSHAEEDDSGLEGPEQMVLNNAALKAKAVAKLFPEDLILGSDTTVAYGNTIFSKPANITEARAMLMRLSGREHTVFTAVSLEWESANFREDFVELSSVRFKPLNDAIIDAYFAIMNPLDKAGAYGIQEGRDLIIDSVVGSVENVMGLPIQALGKRLLEHGFHF